MNWSRFHKALSLSSALCFVVLMHCSTIGCQNPFDIPNQGSAADTAPTATYEQKERSEKTPQTQESSAISESIPLRSSSESSTKQPSGENPFDIRHNPKSTASETPQSTITTTSKTDPNENKISQNRENKKPVKKKNKKTHDHQPWIKGRIWHLVYCVFILGVLALMTSYDRAILSQFMGAMTNINQLKILFRESFLINPSIFRIFYIIFFLTAPYLLFKFFSTHTALQMPLAQLGFLSFAIVTIWYLVRHLSVWFMKYITSGAFELQFYDYQIMHSNIVLGIVLVPIVLLLALGTPAAVEIGLYIGFLLVILFYVYRQIRAFVVTSNFIARNMFHFFVYFCAVEIAPLILVAKYIASL